MLGIDRGERGVPALGPDNNDNFVVLDRTEACSSRTVGFLDHCEDLRGGRAFPRWSDLKLYQLDSAVLPYMAVVDVTRAPDDFVYRYWGTGHTALKGVDMTGKPVSRITATELARIGLRQYQLILEQRRPLIFLHDLKAYGPWKDQIQVAARVPFSEDGETIDKVVSYSNYDEDRELWSERFHQATARRKKAVGC